MGRLRDGNNKRTRNPAGERIRLNTLQCCDSVTCLLCKICGWEVTKADWVDHPNADCTSTTFETTNCDSTSGQDGNEEYTHCFNSEGGNDEDPQDVVCECYTFEYWPLDCSRLNGPWYANQHEQNCETGSFFARCLPLESYPLPSYHWGIGFVFVYVTADCDLQDGGVYMRGYIGVRNHWAGSTVYTFLAWEKFLPFPIAEEDLLEGTIPPLPGFGDHFNLPFACTPDGELEYKALFKGDPDCLKCNDPIPPEEGPCENKLPIQTNINLGFVDDCGLAHPLGDLCQGDITDRCLEITASGTCNGVEVDHITIEGDLLEPNELITNPDGSITYRQPWCPGACLPTNVREPQFLLTFYCDEDEEDGCKARRSVGFGDGEDNPPEEGLCDWQCCNDPEEQVTFTFPITTPSEITDYCYPGGGDFGIDCALAGLSCAANHAAGFHVVHGARVTINPSNQRFDDACCNFGHLLSLDWAITNKQGGIYHTAEWCSPNYVKKISDCTYEVYRCGRYCRPDPNHGGSSLYVVVTLGGGEPDDEQTLIPCSLSQSYLVSNVVYSP